MNYEITGSYVFQLSSTLKFKESALNTEITMQNK